MVIVDTKSVLTPIASCTYSAVAFWILTSPLSWDTDRPMFTCQAHGIGGFRTTNQKSWGHRYGIDMKVRLYDGAGKKSKL